MSPPEPSRCPGQPPRLRGIADRPCRYGTRRDRQAVWHTRNADQWARRVFGDLVRLDPGWAGGIADCQPRGGQVERGVEAPIDPRVDRAGVAVADDGRLTDQTRRLHEMK